MSELTLPSEVRELGEVARDTALGSYLMFAALPKSSDGLQVYNKVTGEAHSVPSITYINDSIRGGGNIDLLSIAPNIYTEDFAFLVDIDLGNLAASGGGLNLNIFDLLFARSGDGVRVGYRNHYNPSYGGIYGGATWNYVGATYHNNGVYNTNTVALVWWCVATKTMTMFVDGVQFAQRVFTSYNSTLTGFYFRLPYTYSRDTTSAINLAVYLKKSSSFTEQEITQLATNPYSLFKTAEEDKTYYGVNYPELTDANIVVNGIVGDTTVEITLTRDLANSGGTEYLFDSRLSGGLRYYSSNGGAFDTGSGISGNPMLNGVASGGTEIRAAKAGDVITVNLSNVNGSITIGARETGASSQHGLGLSLIRVMDDNGTHVFSLNQTTGDTVDSLTSGLQLVLSGFDADKWQPVIPTEEFTVGTAFDYPDTKTAVIAREAVVGIQRLILQQDDDQAASRINTAQVDGNITEITSNSQFDGRPSSVPTITSSNAGAVLRTGSNAANSTLLINNVNIVNTGVGVGLDLDSPDGEHEVRSISCSSPSSVAVRLEFNGAIRDSLLYNCDTGVSAPSIGNKYASNCSVVGATNRGFRNIKTKNCIANGAPSDAAFSSCEGSHNISEDSTASAIGVGSIDFTGAFVNSAALDFRINQAWADTNLVSQGWNSSDIASWAYYVAVGLTRLSKNYAAMVSLTGRISKDHGVLVDLLSRESKTFSVLASLLQTGSVSKNFVILLSTVEKRTEQYAAMISTMQRIGKSHQFSSSLAQKVSKTYDTLVTTLARLAKGQIFEITALERVVKDYQANISALMSESVAYGLKLNANERVSLDHELRLNTLYRESLACEFNMTLLQREFISYDVLSTLYGRVSHDHTLNVTTLYRGSKSFIVLHDFLSANSAVKSFTIMLSLKQRMEKEFSSQMTLLNRAFKDHEFVATALQKEVKDFDVVSNLLTRVAKDYAAIIQANHKQSKDYTISLSSISRVGKIYDIVFTLEGDGLGLTPSHYVLGVGGVLDFTKESGNVLSYSEKPITILFD